MTSNNKSQQAGGISVVINTCNAARHLERVLRSVEAFDEVVVCDMESTDDTAEIARRHRCRVVTFPKGDCKSAEPARTFAIQSARCKWVLVVDADELVTTELRDYLYKRIASPDCPHGLWLPRVNHFMGHPLRCRYPDYILRFFIREGTTWPPFVHTLPTVNGRQERVPTGRRDLALVHIANDHMATIVEKTNRYTDNEVEKKSAKRYGMAALLWRPAWRFFKAYVLKRGFMDGREGFIYACYEALYQFVMVSKMMERRIRREV